MNKEVRNYILFVIIVITCLLGYSTISYRLNLLLDKEREVSEKIEEVIYDTMTTRDSVIYYLFKHNVEHPDIVLKQFIVESGYFNSDLSLNYNNISGMKNPLGRFTKSIGYTNNGYAIYKSLEDCIIDYKYWQLKYASNKTVSEYYDYLSRVYAEDTNYIKVIKGIRLK
jgi:uncharacterized FlgJ-related protein